MTQSQKSWKTRETIAESFADFLSDALPDLLRFLKYRHSVPFSDCEDVAQEAIFRVLKKLHELEDATEPPERPKIESVDHLKRYLFNTAHYVAIETWRKRRPIPSGDIGIKLELPDPRAAAEFNEQSESLQSAIDQLSEAEREVLLQRFALGHSRKQISADTGFGLSKVRNIEAAAVEKVERLMATATPPVVDESLVDRIGEVFQAITVDSTGLEQRLSRLDEDIRIQNMCGDIQGCFDDLHVKSVALFDRVAALTHTLEHIGR